METFAGNIRFKIKSTSYKSEHVDLKSWESCGDRPF